VIKKIRVRKEWLRSLWIPV